MPDERTLEADQIKDVIALRQDALSRHTKENPRETCRSGRRGRTKPNFSTSGASLNAFDDEGALRSSP